jgi:hypothetical protein
MHTHPWDFRSYVVAGKVINCRFVEAEQKTVYGTYKRQTIKCGIGGGLIGEPEEVNLWMKDPEVYSESEVYFEEAEEIHLSMPEDGTVTLVKREFKDDVDHAYVFWLDGEWGSAEPREATREEISMTLTHSLNTWFI